MGPLIGWISPWFASVFTDIPNVGYSFALHCRKYLKILPWPCFRADHTFVILDRFLWSTPSLVKIFPHTASSRDCTEGGRRGVRQWRLLPSQRRQYCEWQHYLFQNNNKKNRTYSCWAISPYKKFRHGPFNVHAPLVIEAVSFSCYEHRVAASLLWNIHCKKYQEIINIESD